MVIRSAALFGALAACTFLFTAPAAQAATITVNSAADTADAPGDGICGSVVPNSCTLRAAIEHANLDAAGDTITFSIGGPTVALSALPPITQPLTIDGGAGYTINGGDVASLVQIPAGAGAGAYVLKNLTIANGLNTASTGGGAVYYAPVALGTSLTLTDVTISSSSANAGPGGGIAAEILPTNGAVTLLRVNIIGNSASGAGGGFWLRIGATGTASLDDSSVTGNTAGSGGNGNGGGIHVRRGRLSIGSSTISGNTASGSGQGGGIFLENQDIGGSIRLDNSTVVGNTNDAIAVEAGNPAASWITFSTLHSTSGATIRAAAPATSFPGNVSNPFTSNIVGGTTPCTASFSHSDATNSGYNLSHGASCGFNQTTDKSAANDGALLLDALSDNPVSPQTRALLAGSPAIDAGNAAWDTGADQRGADTQDGGADGTPGNSTAVRDIGAYEFGGFGLVQFGFTTGTNFDAPEDVTPAALSIKRYGTGTAATSAPTVAFSTTAGTASQGTSCTGGADYTALASNPMNFSFTGTPGLNQFDQTASIPICKDEAVEGNQTFNIALADPAAGDTVGFDFGPKASGTVTIVDRENGEFRFDNTVSPHAANEGNAGSNGSVTLTILRTAGTGTYGAVRVTYSTTTADCPTTACTAEANDFTAVASGTVDFADGETSKTITINFVGDAAYEVESGGGETFRVTLDAVGCLNLQSGQSCDARRVGTATDANRFALVEITNDDTATPGRFEFSATGYQALEASGAVTITVKRLGGSDGAVTVECGAVDGTGAGAAKVTDDYFAPVSGVPPPNCELSWGDGVVADRTFTVNLNNDGLTESNKTFSVTLSNPAGGAGGQTPTVATAAATVTLISDEQPAFVFANTSLSVNEGSAVQPVLKWGSFTGGDVSVPYYTADGTATSPIDYTGIPQGTPTTLTITAAETNSRTLSGIATFADAPEGNENFTVHLGTPVNGGQLGGDDPVTTGVTEGPTATVTITDPPSAAFTATSYTRANEANNSTIALTVRRQGNTAQSMDVDFTISAACATAPCATESVDYTRSGGFTGTVHWNAGVTTDQTISITVIGDTLIEGDEGIKVTLSNARVNGTTPADVGTPGTAAAVIPDDDYRFEVVETSPVAIGEAGGNAVVTVRRFGSTVGAATVNYATADGTATQPGDYTQATGTLTWNAGVGGTQTVSVPIVGDAVDEANESFTVALASPSNNSSGEATTITGSPITVQITDDDTAGVTVTQSGGTTAVAEGGATDTYTIVLNSQPTADVTIAVTGDADLGGAPASLTFTSANWNVAQTVTATAVNDAQVEGAHSGTLTHAATSADAAYNGIAIGSVTASIDDSPGVTVAQSGGTTAITEGGATDTYTIVLNSPPGANVTITVTGDADVGGTPASLTFTSANWNVAQTVTVTAVNDAQVEGAHSGTLSHAATSADGNYNGIAVASVTANITDNDIAGVTVTASGGSTAVTEGGATDTVTVQLNSQPAANVTITLSPGAQLTVAPTSLTFTPANWNVAQTVTVRAVDDAQTEGTHAASVGGTIASTDADYNGALVPVSVTITDNDGVIAGEDAPGVVVTPSGNAATGGGGGGAFSWTALLGLFALAGLRRRTTWAALLALASAPAFAETVAQAPKGRATQPSSRFSYDAVDVRYLSVKVDDPRVDAGGFALAGSWEIGKSFYAALGYSAIETDNFRLQGVVGASETTAMSLGLGLHYPMRTNLDFTTAVNVISAEAEGQGGFRGSSDDTGFGIEGGLRGRLSPTFEWTAGLSWVSIFGDDDTALVGQSQWRVGRNFGLLAGIGFGSNSSQLSAGLRYNF